MDGEETESAWPTARARTMADALDLPDVASDALNTLACVGYDQGVDWYSWMREALDLALDHGLHDQAGRAYANLHGTLTDALRYAETDRWFREGMAYCERERPGHPSASASPAARPAC